MCGIAGFVGRVAAGSGAADRLRAMAGTLIHRGPDSHGTWTDPESGAYFAHRRLSIVDLTETGHQPMVSANGRFVITFNGEIYNFLDLRRTLEAGGAVLVGRSDTEVLLEWIARRGLATLLAEIEGMFAFALWDRLERRLHLVRDRVGIKPLFFTRRNGVLAFASELKALHHAPGWSSVLDPDALALYLRFGYVPAPRTIFAQVSKLEPGSMLSWRPGEEAVVQRYWDAVDIVAKAAARPIQARDDDLIELVGSEIERSVRQEIVADVPVGCFLSGGVDSSTVAAMMQRICGRTIKTFSVGFDDQAFDESHHARAVAAHLGTDHQEIRVSAWDAREVIAALPGMYDEPLSDMAQIPTHLVSRLARRDVKVALSGDGGDEIFAGYDRYATAERAWRKLALMPGFLRRGASALLHRSVGPMASGLGGLNATGSVGGAARRLARIAAVLPSLSPVEAYRLVSSLWEEPSALLPGCREPHLPAYDARLASGLGLPTAFQLVDLRTYLPDAILAKVDRASMAASLEVRVPLLNHRLIELAFRLPLSAKRRNGTTKWVLRQLLYRSVPRKLVDRPKQGFGVPMARWLRGPLRDWAEDRLSPASLGRTGVLDATLVARCWGEHVSGRLDWSYRIWAALVLQDWLLAWQPAPGKVGYPNG
jgi:asparagine synthase (glutamine-hydrolysing)